MPSKQSSPMASTLSTSSSSHISNKLSNPSPRSDNDSARRVIWKDGRKRRVRACDRLERERGLGRVEARSPLTAGQSRVSFSDLLVGKSAMIAVGDGLRSTRLHPVVSLDASCFLLVQVKRSVRMGRGRR